MVSALEISADSGDLDEATTIVSDVSMSDISDGSDSSINPGDSNNGIDSDIGNDIMDEKMACHSKGLSDEEKLDIRWGIDRNVYTRNETIEIRVYDKNGPLEIDIDVYLNDEYYGSITTYCNEEDGVPYIPLGNLNLGLNNITVVYEDEYHYPFNQTENFTLYETRAYLIYPDELKAPYFDMPLGFNKTLDVYLVDGFDQEKSIDEKFNLTLYSYRENEYLKGYNFTSKGSVDYASLINGTGEYIIRANYGGSSDYKYAPTSFAENVNCYNVVTEIIINDTFYIPNDGFEFSVYLINSFEKNILDKTFNVLVRGGGSTVLVDENITGSKTFKIKASKIPAYVHSLTITSVFGKEGFNYSYYREYLFFLLEDSRTKTEIDSNLPSVVIGNPVKTDIILRAKDHENKQAIRGYLDVYSNDNYLTTVLTSNESYAPISLNLSKGLHNLTFVYNGSKEYQPVTYSILAKVYNWESKIKVKCDDIIVGDTAIASFNLYNVNSGKSLNKTFSVYLYLITETGSFMYMDGRSISNGNISYSDLPAGDYRINAVYKEKGYSYSPCETDAYFTVYDKDTKISFDRYIFPENEVVVFNLSLCDMLDGPINGTLHIDFNGTGYTVNAREEGSFLNLGKLSAGDYSISSRFDGDDEFNACNRTYQFRVLECPIIKIEAGDVLKGRSERVNITFTDANGNPLDYKMLNIHVVCEDDNTYAKIVGKESFLIKNITKNYIIHADNFEGMPYSSLEYYPVNAYASIRPIQKMATVIHAPNMETTAVDTASDGRVGEYFNVVLRDSSGKALEGKAVQIGFNGKIYNRTTDEKGSCRLQINLPRVDLYTFAVCFLGDDDYNGSFQVACIDVKAQTPELTASAKSFKASAKTKTLTATFKTENGNGVRGKKLTFTINGKSYTGTTDAKGVVSVKISLTKKGSYTCIAKYQGDSTYKATSTKFNVKIV